MREQSTATATVPPSVQTNGSAPLHQRIEFAALPDKMPASKLSVCVYGPWGVGKSRFIATAPGPIGVIPLDEKTRRTVYDAKMLLCPDKTIYFPKHDYIRHANPMQLAMMEPNCGKKVLITVNPPGCCAIHYYRWFMNGIKDAVWSLVEKHDVRTIAIDSFSQLYDSILYAHYGRSFRISTERTAYGPVNEEAREIINTLHRHHFIATSQSKEEYKNNVPTGNNIPKGFVDIGYYVSTLVEMYRHDKPAKRVRTFDDGTVEETAIPVGEFGLDVRMCQEKASLFGEAGRKLLLGPEIDFTNLAIAIYGDNKDFDVEEYQ